MDADVQKAIEPILVVNEQTLVEGPSFVRRKGKWIQRRAGRGTVLEISNEDAATLERARILVSYGDALTAGMKYHRLLEGLLETGYRSWEGVTEIRRVEEVPQGVTYEPRPNEHYGHRQAEDRAVARLDEDGFHLQRLHFDKRTPTVVRKAYASMGITDAEPLIAVIIRGGKVWPDFSRNIPAEIEGRLDIRCVPELDHRYLPGPLGALYHAPAEDRMLIERYLFRMENSWGLDPYEAWRDTSDDPWEGYLD